MPLVVNLAFNGSQDHMNIGQDLGFLLGGIKKGTISKATKNAYFSGFEFEGTSIKKKDEVCYFLKKDVSSLNMLATKAVLKNAPRGSSGRIFVKFDKDDQMVPGFAALWNHADKAWTLDAGFFKRAEQWM